MAGQGFDISIAHRTTGGRVRLRCPGLRGRAALAARVEAGLRGDGRFEAVSVRLASGSIVAQARGAMAAEALIAAVERALVTPAPAPATERAAEPAMPARMPEPAASEGWHLRPLCEVAGALEADLAGGLSAAEARRRLARDGPNAMDDFPPASPWKLFSDQFRSLPVAMLAVSATVSLATGGVSDAVATMSVVLVNAVFGFVTEGQAEASIHKLMDSSQEPVRVLRDGHEAVIRAADVVQGDLYLAQPGTRVPADARLLSAVRLKIDESTLTGETLAVDKAPDAEVAAEAPIGGRANMLHSGTLVAEGHGRALVVATGARTAAAQVAWLSATATRPQAPVEAELDRLGGALVKVSLAACGLFFGIGWMRGAALAEILKDALALAVAAVPEGLPVVATTTMALGLRRMERRGILIRRVDTVESLGALQVLCLDKTGTLTQNRLQVVEAVTGLARAGGPVPEAARLMAEVAALNNDAEPGAAGAEGSSATERAVLDFAMEQAVDVAALRRARPRIAVLERTRQRPVMATFHAGNGPATAVKGAPETVLRRCDWVVDAGGKRALTGADRDRLLALNDALAARPARVLGFAVGDDPDWDGEAGGLTWLGLVAMSDPLRPGARDFVGAMHRAGIRTVMITGDQAATAGAIARELDLSDGAPLRIVDAPELSRLDPELLAGVARQAHAFSRVSAPDKLAIVRALQADGSVVGMTGDGVNDGPALKAADVGIAMGASGSSLARDVANVVIRDDRLETLVDGVAQGRAVYRNIRRSLEFLISTNISEIIVGIAEALHGPGELETPMELLWINLVSDVLPGLGLALADPDEDAMTAPPRRQGEPVIPREDMARMLEDSATIAASTLVSHLVGLARFGPGPETRGMTFLSLSLGQLFYTLTSQQTDIRKLEPGRLLENRMLDSALLTSITAAVLPFFVPRLRRLLGIAPLDAASSAVALAAAVAPAASVLARRGISLQLETVEGRVCETS